MRPSASILPGSYECGQNEFGKLHVRNLGASIACWGIMPNTVMFRKYCKVAWHWASPPGVPNGIHGLPSLKARRAFGVKRGRLPGMSTEGCRGSSHVCVPRPDGVKPSVGATGAMPSESDGVTENILPHLSTAQAYDVSGSAVPFTGGGGS